MVTAYRGPIRGIRDCPACGRPETKWGISERPHCTCTIDDAHVASPKCACDWLGYTCNKCLTAAMREGDKKE